jgi:hypothetical protein
LTRLNTTLFFSPLQPHHRYFMANELEAAVKAASEHLTASRTSSLNGIATVYSISPSTLKRGLSGGASRQESHSFQQLLSPDQAEKLVSWILDLEKQGHALIYK